MIFVPQTTSEQRHLQFTDALRVSTNLLWTTQSTLTHVEENVKKKIKTRKQFI